MVVPSAGAADAGLRALRGVKLYPAPDAAPIHDGVVLLRDGRIVAVGPRDAENTNVPSLAPECEGGVLVAGFQNSHVHLNGPAFAKATGAKAATLEKGLEALLTRYGFTTAFDIASDRDNTLALRQRINQGELKGPRLLTAGLPLFPAQGLPVYLDHFDAAFLAKLPQPHSVDAALKTIRQNLDAGAEATKLFLVTPQRNRPPKRMSADIAQAAAAETHRRGHLVFAHPTDLDGVRAALRAKVDILAHPPLGTPGPWPVALMDELRNAGVYMVPTLKLLRHELNKEKVPPRIGEPILQDSVREFGRFAAAGGKVLFGTDVDYMEDSDPTEEYELMAQAGLSPMQILASLTTTPAERWQESSRRGRLAPGQDADIVALGGDPMQSEKHFANVKCAVRGGRVVFAR
ncbi:amidohydrolase family protein [Roseateles asaccharophilus]|uniref:Imidazolonepropionase-like amidohydrolase n=1 Tax=Roseateles asaccharophilus TaxID=582607 RepID=A0ABU2AFG5_9BURK|nr:amidohydrolase family protein [Roseateles asaccharophilus]MDR7335964.1 imidazolonepropionase-like amidohydrolase [Roseateles asaccharophilus]